MAAPLRVVPDGEGGISFERRDEIRFQSLDVLQDGSIELHTFRDCRLVSKVRYNGAILFPWSSTVHLW